jgi:hypothetical protein
MTIHHLAQLNIARLVAPLDSPPLKEFVDFLDPVNRFAEESPGFVWRLVGEDGQSSSYLPPAFADPLTIVNMSVWQDLASLQQFIYQTVHRYFLQSRRKWFEKLDGPSTVLWWIPAGQLPTLDEAKEKLRLLEARGPTPDAFSLTVAFDAGGAPLAREVRPATNAAT